MLEMKNILEMKNSFDRLNSRLHTAEESTSKLRDRSIKISIQDLWDNTKLSSIHATKVQEGEEEEQGQKSKLRYIRVDFLKIKNFYKGNLKGGRKEKIT